MLSFKNDNVKLKIGKRYPKSLLRRTESTHHSKDEADATDMSALAAATAATRARPVRKATTDGSTIVKLAHKVSSFFFTKVSTADAADAEHAEQ